VEGEQLGVNRSKLLFRKSADSHRRVEGDDAPLPGGKRPKSAIATVVPDLAVEVLSPDDRPGEVRDKVGDWLGAGARLVWTIDPERRSAAAYTADGLVSLLNGGDSLSGAEVLPGFVCPLSELW